MRDERTWTQYAAIAGIVFVVLTIVGAFLPGQPPKPDDSIATIRSFYADHRSAILLSAYVGGVATAFGLWYIAALSVVVRRAEGGGGILALTTFAGGAVTSVVGVIGLLVSAALAYSSRSDDVLRTMFDFGNMSFALIMFPWAVFTAAASVVMIRTGLFARWLGWAGIAAAALMLISAAGLGQTSGAWAAAGAVSIVTFIVGMIWILATAIFMLRSSMGEQSQTTQAA